MGKIDSKIMVEVEGMTLDNALLEIANAEIADLKRQLAAKDEALKSLMPFYERVRESYDPDDEMGPGNDLFLADQALAAIEAGKVGK